MLISESYDFNKPNIYFTTKALPFYFSQLIFTSFHEILFQICFKFISKHSQLNTRLEGTSKLTLLLGKQHIFARINNFPSSK